MDMECADLMSSLQLHNDYFKSMTDLIPARYYFEQESKQGPAGSGKFFHNAKEKAPKQKVKDKSKKKTSNKRQRLDPDQQRSVTQIQEGMDKGQISGKDGIATSSRLWKEKSEDESESDAMGTGLEDLSDDSGNEDDSKPSVSSRIKPMSVESVSSSATIDELREKVRQRIEELRTKRKAKAPLMEDVVPKKVARREAEKEKKKKADAIKAMKASKAQLEILEKAKQNKLMVNGDGHSDSDDSSDDNVNQRTKKSNETSTKGGKGGKKMMEDKEAAVGFSQFDFTESEREQPKKKKRKKVTEPRSNKDFGRLLKKAELKEKKMAEMKEKDPEKAQEVETEGKWKTVIDRAQGIKVKDDVELLKKSIKRKEQRKNASKKQWEARQTKLEEKMKQKETKKRTNIKAKTDARKAKKVKKLQKKGKLLLQD
ncbi:surfeit locus protein 6 homolog [Lytechinus pictus]|uniref:surfeit locus protein 6 homolog n=1 Tax=Lytechinus pictus TaxID=7653 RepID=UPI0030B9E64F